MNMPDFRYYDYGVMRREADRRMYDAQLRVARDDSMPTKRVTCGCGGQTEHTAEKSTTENNHAPCVCEDAVCENAAQIGNSTEHVAKAKHTEAGLSAEELLIVALLMLAISEGSSLPLILALLYLLL